MYKLDLEKAEEPKTKFSTFIGSQGKQRNSSEASTSASLTVLMPLTVWITIHWKILKEMGILEHLICLLRNLYVSQEVKIRTRHGTMNWFKIGKGV